MEFGFPVLSAIVFIPIVAGIILLFMPANNRDLIRGVAITAAAIILALSALVFFTYNNIVATRGALLDSASYYTMEAAFDESIGQSIHTQMFTEALLFEEYVPWVESLGIAYHVGVDGLSAPMVLLTGMVTVAGVLISWNIQDRLREFMAFFMLLVAGVYGVFVALDLFMLFFFY